VSPAAVLAALLLVVVTFLVVYPLAHLLYGSFRVSLTSPPGALTLDHYIRVYSDLRTYVTFGVTVVYALGFTVLAMVVALPLAWIAARTDTPLRKHIPWLILIPYVIPASLHSVAWLLLLDPGSGIVNQAFRAVTRSDAPFFNVYSLAGMIWISFTIALPPAFTLLTAGLERMDPTLEEAASTSGANGLQTLRRILVPLTLPSLLSVFTLLFIVGLEAFDVPAFVGLPANIRVLTSEIYYFMSQNVPSQPGRAAAFGTLPLLLAVPLTVYCVRVIVNQERFAVITGKAWAPRVVQLGPFRWITLAFFLVVYAIVSLLPVLVLVGAAIFPDYKALAALDFSTASFKNFTLVLENPVTFRAFGNSILLATFGGLATILLAFGLSYISTRTRIRGRTLFEFLAFIPYSLPSILLGVGLLFGYVAFPIDIYGTVWLLGLAYTTKYLPYGLRSTSAALLQIHRDLEEAATVSGASKLRAARTVLLPLALSGFVAGWSIVAIHNMREFSMSILLYGPGSEVASVLFYEYWQDGRIGEIGALGLLLIGLSLTLLLGANRLRAAGAMR
jgi:iron(III) transport system permease protein